MAISPVSYPAAVTSPVGGELNYSFSKGARSTASAQAKRIVPQYIEELEINANVAPFTAMSEKLGTRKTVKAPTYFHSERDWNPIIVLEAGFGALVGATTFYLRPGDGNRINVGKILRNWRTYEGMRVTNVTLGTGPTVGGVATDTVTVTRALPGGGVGTINPNEELGILGFADVEGSQAPDPMSSEPKLQTNAVQTFRQPYKLTNRDIGLEVYGTAEWKRVAEDASEDLLRQVEQTFLFNNFVQLQDPYITGGYQNFVQTNVTDFLGNALTELGLRDNYIRPFMRRNSGEKECFTFVGELPRNAFDGFGLNNIRYYPEDDEIGIDVGYYQSSHGRVKLVPHSLMGPLGSNVSATSHGKGGMMLGINMKKCGQAIYKDRDIRALANRQLPSEDARMDELLCDKGFWIGAELSHCWCEGIGG